MGVSWKMRRLFRERCDHGLCVVWYISHGLSLSRSLVAETNAFERLGVESWSRVTVSPKAKLTIERNRQIAQKFRLESGKQKPEGEKKTEKTP